MPVSPVNDANVQKLYNLRKNMQIKCLTGDFSGYKKVSREYASYAVRHSDALQKVPNENITVPLFSKYFLNVVQVLFLNRFRKKSPEEKELKKIGEEIRAEKKLNEYRH